MSVHYLGSGRFFVDYCGRVLASWFFYEKVSSMIAMGVDPGTRNLGWGIVSSEGNRLEHRAHGVIRVSGDWSLSRRLLTISQELDEVIRIYQPRFGSVEDMFVHKNPQSAIKLAHARGVVLLCLEKGQIPIREHAPARVKRTLAGNGRAGKPQVAQMVKAILGLESLPPEDASDALALAITELRLDPRARLLQVQKSRNQRKKMPVHLAEAIKRAKLKNSR